MLLFFVLAVLHFINEASYRSEEWQAYREFNELEQNCTTMDFRIMARIRKLMKSLALI